MSKKDTLLKKLFQTPLPRDFTINELDTLMSKCGCEKYQGGRGSGVRYVHLDTKRMLTFDLPHPGKELKLFHVKEVKKFLEEIGEV